LFRARNCSLGISKGHTMTKSQSIEMAKYRKEFPFTKETIFFNHASFGPMPEVSWMATQEYYQGLRLRKVADDDEEAFRRLQDIRELIGKMIKATPEEIWTECGRLGIRFAGRGQDSPFGCGIPCQRLSLD
jgi:selenocysteine lyase/cysteine desulfurase